MAYCLECLRRKQRCGPLLNRDYMDVANQAREIGETGETLEQYRQRRPNERWFDPAHTSYLIEVSKETYDRYRDKTELFHDGLSNLPKWQQRNTTSGDPLDLGSYSDPETVSSTFNPGKELADERFVLRVYDKDPVAFPNDAKHLAHEEFSENDENPLIERFLRLFHSDDRPINRNVANDRIVVGGVLLDLDWGSSANPPLSAGVCRLFVEISETGNAQLSSDAGWRVAGPGGEKAYSWTIFTKILRVR